MGMTVTQSTALGIIRDPSFPALRAEYAAECALAGLPDPQEKESAYAALDQSGALTLFRADVGGVLAGFVSVLAPVLPHYGVTVAVTESLFVAARYRKSGAGLALIRRAERYARGIGSPGMLISAPSGGRLVRLLPCRAWATAKPTGPTSRRCHARAVPPRLAPHWRRLSSAPCRPCLRLPWPPCASWRTQACNCRRCLSARSTPSTPGPTRAPS